MLAYPSFNKPFILETDASIRGIGAVISQYQEDGLVHPVAYASRSLNPAERNCSITELETLAVVWATQHFRSCLYGHAVTVYTDHTAVKAILETPNPSGKHARWWTKVYGSGIKEVKIVYRSVKSNVSADALSRSPQADAPVEGGGQSKLQVAAVTSENCVGRLGVQISVIASGQESIDDATPSLLTADPQVAEHRSISEEQGRDEQLAEVIHFLKSGKLPEDPKRAKKIALQQSLFALVEGILYYIDPKRQNGKRIAVPHHLRTQILEENHHSGMGGHFSGKRLFNALVRHWWWEGMYADVVGYVRNCPECAIVTGGGRRHRPPSQ